VICSCSSREPLVHLNPGVSGEAGRMEDDTIRYMQRSNSELARALNLEDDAGFVQALRENSRLLQGRHAHMVWLADAGLPRTLASEQVDTMRCVNDDKSDGAAQMQSLLDQVKSRAASLECDLVLGDFSDLVIAPQVLQFASGSAEPVVAKAGRAMAVPDANRSVNSLADNSNSVSLIAPSVCLEPMVSSVSADCLDCISPNTAGTTEQLGALLRKLKRKAAELDEASVGWGLDGFIAPTSPADRSLTRARLSF